MTSLELWILTACCSAWFFLTIYLVLDRDTKNKKLKSFRHFLNMEVQAYQTIDSQTQSDVACEKLVKRIDRKFNNIFGA